MKKVLHSILVVAFILCLASCSTTTITDKPGEYEYGLNEEINIVDIDSRKSLGTVKVTGYEIIKNEPFIIEEYKETNSSGEKVYEDVTYAQLVQIYYTYTCIDSSKSFSGANFVVLGDTVKANESDFTGKPKEGNHNFMAALKNRDGYIKLHFNYNALQTKSTAKIKFDIK